MIEKGDIILIKKGTVWYLFSPLIKLFTWEWWKNEPIPEFIHGELGDHSPDPDKYNAVSAQPPVVTGVTRKFKDVEIKVWRLKSKPPDFNTKFHYFVATKKGKPYDFPTFLMFGFDWIFHVKLFSKMMKGKLFVFCMELIAEFYQEIGIPCSENPPQSTSPDDVDDYCSASDKFFEVKIGKKKKGGDQSDHR